MTKNAHQKPVDTQNDAGSESKKLNKQTVLIYLGLLVLVLLSASWLALHKSPIKIAEQTDSGALTAEQRKNLQEKQKTNAQIDVTGDNKSLVGNSPKETAQNVAQSLGAPQKETVVAYIDLGDFQFTNGLYEQSIVTYESALVVANPGEQKMTIYIGIAEAAKAIGKKDIAKQNYNLAFAEIAKNDETYDAMKADITERINAL